MHPTMKDAEDAARYRWLRGGPEIPQHSTRWPRWEVRYWDGRHWQTLFADQLDSAIDTAISHETPNEQGQQEAR